MITWLVYQQIWFVLSTTYQDNTALLLQGILVFRKRFEEHGVGSFAHVEICGWHSPTTTSCCGLPEGDALSVFAMVQLNLAWNLYMRAFCPQVGALSFVDNFALVANVVEHLLAGLASLVEFFRLWNLQVDSAKSYYCALTTGARKQLALLPFRTVTSATELGGVLSFTKRHWSGQQLKKPMALETRWKAVQQSWPPCSKS